MASFAAFRAVASLSYLAAISFRQFVSHNFEGMLNLVIGPVQCFRNLDVARSGADNVPPPI